MKLIIYLTTIVSQILITLQQTNFYRCPRVSSEPMRIYGNKCYEFNIHRRRSANEAKSDCHRKGGRLATVESMGVQAFMYNTLRSIGFGGEGVWIGLTDAGHEGRYTWDSGAPLTFTYWAKGQPGFGASLEDCVLFKISDGDHGHWHDYQCDDILFVTEDDAWICEYAMKPVTTMKPIVTTQTTTKMVPTTTPIIMTDKVTPEPPTTTKPTTAMPTTTTTTTPMPTTTTTTPMPTTTTTTPMPTTITTTPTTTPTTTTTTTMQTTTTTPTTTPMPTAQPTTPPPTTPAPATTTMPSTTTEPSVLIG